MGIEDIEGKTAREYASDALEAEMGKKGQDVRGKMRISNLNKILKLLPDEDKPDEVREEETPNINPHDRVLKSPDNII